MSDLTELIERVERATGPSDILDAEIYATLGGAPNTTTSGNRIIPLVLTGDPKSWPAYTASIDAAVALIESKLPGWVHGYTLCHSDFLEDNSKPFAADLGGPVTWRMDEGWPEPDFPAVGATAPTPALALILALLRALQSLPMQTDTPKADPREVIAAGEDLKSIVEGIDGAMRHGTWRDEHGMRLKDTPEWVRFYNALTASGLSIVPVATGDVGDLVERLRNERPVSMLGVLALHLRAASALESLAARAEAAEAALSPAPAVDEKTEGEGR